MAKKQLKGKSPATKVKTSKSGAVKKAAALSISAPKKPAKAGSKKAAPKAKITTARAKKTAIKTPAKKAAVVKKTAKLVKRAAVKKTVPVKKSAKAEKKAKSAATKPVRKTRATVPATKSAAMAKKTTVRHLSVHRPAKVTKPVAVIAETQIPPPKPKPAYSPQILQELRESLLQERARLIGELRSLESRTFTDGSEEETSAQQPGFSMQLADSAAENIETEIALGIRSIEADTLNQINDALRAMERGDYGICQGSGEPIELERLRIKPWAKYSVKFLRQMEARKA